MKVFTRINPGQPLGQVRMEMCNECSDFTYNKDINTCESLGLLESRQNRGVRQRETKFEGKNKQRKLSHNMDMEPESSDKENQCADRAYNSSQNRNPPPMYLLDPQEREKGLETIVFKNLFTKEIDCKLTYAPNAMYVKYRHLLVEWMAEVCEEYRLPMVICHLSVRLMDELLGKENVPKKNLQLVSLCCILVAAKYREPEQNIPTIQELNECSDFAYECQQIIDVEMVVLKSLKWTIGLPTSSDFVQYYSKKTIIFDDDCLKKNGERVGRREHNLMLKYVKFFSELAMLEYSMSAYLPSHLAASIVCCSRIATCLRRTWGPRLERLTCYNLKQIEKCKDHLYGIFLERYPAEASAINQAANPNRSPESVVDFLSHI